MIPVLPCQAGRQDIKPNHQTKHAANNDNVRSIPFLTLLACDTLRAEEFCMHIQRYLVGWSVSLLVVAGIGSMMMRSSVSLGAQTAASPAKPAEQPADPTPAVLALNVKGQTSFCQSREARPGVGRGSDPHRSWTICLCFPRSSEIATHACVGQRGQSECHQSLRKMGNGRVRPPEGWNHFDVI
jgi:hypothetical protein